MNQQDIQDRIAGRNYAQKATSLVGEKSPEFLRSFARHLRNYADSILGDVQSELRVMSKQEAAKFEQAEIKFGIHEGKKFGEVPISYLTWVADKNLDLQAYLRSDLGKKRINEEG